MTNLKDTQAIKAELIANHGFSSDRELIKLLGIKDEDKAKLFAWINYQCAYSYNDGFSDGNSSAKETRDNEKSFNDGMIEGRAKLKEELLEVLGDN